MCRPYDTERVYHLLYLNSFGIRFRITCDRNSNFIHSSSRYGSLDQHVPYIHHIFDVDEMMTFAKLGRIRYRYSTSIARMRQQLSEFHPCSGYLTSRMCVRLKVEQMDRDKF